MKLIYIEWEDVESQVEWLTREELGEWISKKVIVKEVGWMVKETKDTIIIANQIEGEDAGMVSKIPKTHIRKIKDL